MKLLDSCKRIEPGTGNGLFGGLKLAMFVVLCLYVGALPVELANNMTGGFLHEILVDPRYIDDRANLFSLGSPKILGIFDIWGWRSLLDIGIYCCAVGGPIGAVYGYALRKQITRKEKQLSNNGSV